MKHFLFELEHVSTAYVLNSLHEQLNNFVVDNVCGHILS